MNKANHLENIKNVEPVALIAVAMMVFIFVESSQPPLSIFIEIPGLDKFAHFVIFGLLAVFIHSSLIKIRPDHRNICLVVTLIFTAIIGISDEIYQQLNPKRSFETLDLLADMSGALFFLLFIKSNFNRSSKV